MKLSSKKIIISEIMPLSKDEVENLLKKEEIVFIATTKTDGSPHLVPIWFIYHNGKIYFETDTTTVKFKNIKRNNKISLCFGGKNTYIIEGAVKWFKEKELEFPIRKMYWKKYGKDMDNSYINEKTLIFEVIPQKEMSWHYAPDWD